MSIISVGSPLILHGFSIFLDFFYLSQTDNYDLFGRSWMVIDSPAQCTPDCGDQKPAIAVEKCNFPKKMVEMECDKLFETTPDSPFGVSINEQQNWENCSLMKYSFELHIRFYILIIDVSYIFFIKNIQPVDNDIIYYQSSMIRYINDCPWCNMQLVLHDQIYNQSSMIRYTTSLPWSDIQPVFHDQIYNQSSMRKYTTSCLWLWFKNVCVFLTLYFIKILKKIT